MRDMRLRVILSCCLAITCCFLCHCGVKAPESVSPEVDAAMRRLADRMLNSTLAANAGLETIKGIGRVNLKQNNQTDTFRAAWIGKEPNQIRIEVLAVTGQPILSFASDGSRIYILSYADNRLYRKKVSKGGLKRIISIDMTVPDFLDLLSGRLPIQQGGSVRIEDRPGLGPLLVLEDRGRDSVETVSLDTDRRTVCEFERRDTKGKLLFRVVFDERLETGGFQLPRTMTITDNDGVEIHITVERCWVNPELTEDQFILKAF